MQARLCALLVAPLVLASALARATPLTISVGNPMIDGSILRPYKNAWTFSYQQRGAQPVEAGLWTDELQEETVAGRRVMVRTQEAHYAKRGLRSKNVNAFDPKTLAPISMDWTMNGGDLGENHRIFDGARVKFRRRARIQKMGEKPGPLSQGEATLTEAPFDFFGGMYGIILVALPLAEGLSVQFPSIDEDKESLTWVTVHVAGRQVVPAGKDRKVEAWVVKADTHDGPMTFWLVREPPYIIRLELHPADGPAWLYTMV